MWIRRLSEIALAAGVVLATPKARATPPPSVADDPLSDYRERFKQGMDRYKAGAFAEAIGFWEPIYRELGEQKGYRLAFNIGVAYQELGDATHAAEHLQSFLAQVDARRAHGDTIPPIVQKEEQDARDRVAALTASKGRIRVDPGSPPRPVQVDAMEPHVSTFVAWVNPGQHTVTFAPGTPDAQEKNVDVRAGDLVDVTPPPPAATPAAPLPPSPSPAPAATAPAPPSPPVTRLETEHPFSPVFVYAAGSLTLVAAVVLVPLEAHAWGLHDQYAGEGTISATDRSNFDSARSLAYGAIGATVGLGVVTAALATWYFVGTSKREVVVTPGGIAGRF
ncbi:MAG TPA: hypothetical protein VMI75_06020 [Polyangiaceae bacterium]|nr:hypothetical protein [Polyangiaceae bacterium]